MSGIDKFNNVERIRINASPGNIITVKIHARNLNTRYQTYSLVITGCLKSEYNEVSQANNTQSVQDFDNSSITSSNSMTEPTSSPTSVPITGPLLSTPASSQSSQLYSAPTEHQTLRPSSTSDTSISTEQFLLSSEASLAPSPSLSQFVSPPIYPQMENYDYDVIPSTLPSKMSTSQPSATVSGMRSESILSPASKEPSAHPSCNPTLKMDKKILKPNGLRHRTLNECPPPGELTPEKTLSAGMFATPPDPKLSDVTTLNGEE